MVCYDPSIVLIVILIIILLILIILFAEAGHRNTLPPLNICQQSTTSPPSSFSSSFTSSGVRLQWSGNPTDTMYNVYLGSSPNYSITDVSPLTTTTTDIILPNITTDTFVKVVAIDRNGCKSIPTPTIGYHISPGFQPTSSFLLINGNNILTPRLTLIPTTCSSLIDPQNKFIYQDAHLIPATNPSLCLIADPASRQVSMTTCNGTNTRWTLSPTTGHISLQGTSLYLTIGPLSSKRETSSSAGQIISNSSQKVDVPSNLGIYLGEYRVRDANQRFTIDETFDGSAFKIQDQLTHKLLIYTRLGPVYAYHSTNLPSIVDYNDEWILDKHGRIHPIKNLEAALAVRNGCVGTDLTENVTARESTWTYTNQHLYLNKDEKLFISPDLSSVVVNVEGSLINLN